jgi:hypothetical protein
MGKVFTREWLGGAKPKHPLNAAREALIAGLRAPRGG